MNYKTKLFNEFKTKSFDEIVKMARDCYNVLNDYFKTVIPSYEKAYEYTHTIGLACVDKNYEFTERNMVYFNKAGYGSYSVDYFKPNISYCFNKLDDAIRKLNKTDNNRIKTAAIIYLTCSFFGMDDFVTSSDEEYVMEFASWLGYKLY